jgi:hypothetical protein
VCGEESGWLTDARHLNNGNSGRRQWNETENQIIGARKKKIRSNVIDVHHAPLGVSQPEDRLGLNRPLAVECQIHSPRNPAAEPKRTDDHSKNHDCRTWWMKLRFSPVFCIRYRWTTIRAIE